MTLLRPLLAAALLCAAAHAQARYHLDDVVLADGSVVTGTFEYLPATGYGPVDVVVSGPGGTRVYTDLSPLAQDELLIALQDASLPDLTDEAVFIAPFFGDGVLGADPVIDMDIGFPTAGETTCGDPACNLVYTTGNALLSGRVLLLGAGWDNLGDSLSGAGGAPALQGQGDLGPGSTTSLVVSRGTPLATAFWVLGVGLLQAPFKGGVLVPTVDVLTPLPLDVSGRITLSFPWPAAVPAGVATYHQVWMPGLGGPANFIATNAITATTP